MLLAVLILISLQLLVNTIGQIKRDNPTKGIIFSVIQLALTACVIGISW